jgi:nucleotide-binding universal stress UspA family protein
MPNLKSPRVVLLATDLSESSSIALNYAAGLASVYNANLVLAHVLDPASQNNPMDSSASDLRKLAESAKLELERISQSLLAAHGIAGQVIVRYGNVRDVIFQIQQERSAELVVLGSSGKKKGSGKTLGSIAEAILRSLPCSVLIVGPHVERRPFSERAQAVVFTTDFSPVSLAALPLAAAFSARLSASLLLLHVRDSHEMHAGFDRELKNRKRLQELAESVETTPGRVKYFIESGDIAESAVSFARENNADFIAMGAHHGDLDDGTRLHGIVSDIIREATCPILTIAEATVLRARQLAVDAQP